jgi:hypothetical protein
MTPTITQSETVTMTPTMTETQTESKTITPTSIPPRIVNRSDNQTHNGYLQFVVEEPLEFSGIAMSYEIVNETDSVSNTRFSDISFVLQEGVPKSRFTIISVHPSGNLLPFDKVFEMFVDFDGKTRYRCVFVVVQNETIQLKEVDGKVDIRVVLYNNGITTEYTFDEVHTEGHTIENNDISFEYTDNDNDMKQVNTAFPGDYVVGTYSDLVVRFKETLIVLMNDTFGENAVQSYGQEEGNLKGVCELTDTNFALRFDFSNALSQFDSTNESSTIPKIKVKSYSLRTSLRLNNTFQLEHGVLGNYSPEGGEKDIEFMIENGIITFNFLTQNRSADSKKIESHQFDFEGNIDGNVEV